MNRFRCPKCGAKTAHIGDEAWCSNHLGNPVKMKAQSKGNRPNMKERKGGRQ